MSCNRKELLFIERDCNVFAISFSLSERKIKATREGE